MNTIVDFLKKYKYQIAFILIILGLVFYVLHLNNKMYKLQAQSIVDKQNYQASIDTITKTYNKKIGEFQFTTTSFIGKLEDLEKYNKDFANKLSKMKGEVLAAVDASVSIVVDEIKNVKTEVSQTDDSTFISKGLYFVSDSGFSQKMSVSDKLRISPYYVKTKINGKDTVIIRHRMSSLGMDFGKSNTELKLTFGFTEEKKQYKVWATCPSKYVNISEMTGYYQYFPKQAKPWVLGPSVGYGFNYNARDGVVKPGFFLGANVTYKLLEFGAPRVKKK